VVQLTGPTVAQLTVLFEWPGVELLLLYASIWLWCGHGEWQWQRPTYLVTGGAGFFWRNPQAAALNDGAEWSAVDLVPDAASHPALTSLQATFVTMQQCKTSLRATFRRAFHIAAMLAHGKMTANCCGAATWMEPR